MKSVLESRVSNIFIAKEDMAECRYYEESHKIREKFERDRDRILYSRAFRRLSGKTQVFLSNNDDHIRNRMTHTLEVSQIARTISEALRLNVTLTEAIALGHDLGHTPFGHVGERTLNYIMCGCDTLRDFDDCLGEERGFKHNWQGIRVVTDLEEASDKYTGLNLTKYTLWGILHHSSLKYKGCKNKYNNICMLRRCHKECLRENIDFKLDFYDRYSRYIENKYLTIEAFVVALADEIAQRHHDVEDALEAKIIDFDELYSKIEDIYGSEFGEKRDDFIKIGEINDKEVKIARLGSFIVNLLTYNAIYYIADSLRGIQNHYDMISSEDFERFKEKEEFVDELKEKIYFDKGLKEKDKVFEKFIHNRILNSQKAQAMDGKGSFLVRELFKAYITNPQQLPDKTIESLFNNMKDFNVLENYDYNNNIGDYRDKLNELHSGNDKKYKVMLMRTICDYIAGMTDRYAMQLYSDLYETNQ